MELISYNYRHLLKQDGKPQETNFIDPSTANITLSQVARDAHLYQKNYRDVAELLADVYHQLFFMFRLENKNGVFMRTPTTVLLLDFDEDTSWNDHANRIEEIEREYGLIINGYYETHSFDASCAWKLRYVVQFDQEPSLDEYRDIMLFFANRFGMDKHTTGFGRRVYGSSKRQGTLLTNTPNSLTDFLSNINHDVVAYKDISRIEESEKLASVEQLTSDFRELPIVLEFFASQQPTDLYRWAEKWSLIYETDERGRYMTFFQTIYNYAVFLGDDEYTNELVKHYVALGGKQRQKFGMKNRYRNGEPQFYKYFSWKLFSRQLGVGETNGLLDIVETPVTIDKYLDEKEVYSFLNDSTGKMKLLVSTAGTGKTYTITKSLMEHERPFVFLMPTTAITNNQEKKQKDLISKTAFGVQILSDAVRAGVDPDAYLELFMNKSTTGFFHSKNPIKEGIDKYEYVFATYDQFERYLRFSNRKRDFLILDEAHLLGQYQNISADKLKRLRAITVLPETKQYFDQQVHCTATPFNLPDIYDSKRAYIARSKKSVKLMYCDERLGRTSLDPTVFYPNLLKRALKDVDINKKPRILVFTSASKTVLPEIADGSRKLLGYSKEETELVTADNKDESETYAYLIHGRGSAEAKLVFATSILNTGVDINDEFDYVVVLNTNDLNFLLQALHRDRSDSTQVIFAMQDKQFVPKVWSDEKNAMVALRNVPKLRLSPLRYANLSWMERQELLVHTMKTRTLFGDRIIYTKQNGEAINEPYYAQSSFYSNYVARYVSPLLISNCLTHLLIDHDFEYIGLVQFNENEKGAATVAQVDQSDLLSPSEIPVEVIATQLDQMRGIVGRDGNQYIFAEKYSEVLKSQEYRTLLGLFRRVVDSPTLSPYKSTQLAEVISEHGDIILHSQVEYVIDCMHSSLTNQPSFLRNVISQHHNRVMTTAQSKEFLLLIKSFVTARESNRISNNYVLKLVQNYGYNFEHGRSKAGRYVTLVKE